MLGTLKNVRGLPLIICESRGMGGGGVKSLLHFHCILHGKRGVWGQDSM